MATTREPRPTRGVAMAAPAVETSAGVLEAGWVGLAVEKGASVVTEPVVETSTVVEAASEEGGATGLEGGVSLLRGDAVDSMTEVAEDSTGADEAGGAGGASTDEDAGGGAYEWPGVAGRVEAPHSLTVSVTVTVTAVVQSEMMLALRNSRALRRHSPS